MHDIYEITEKLVRFRREAGLSQIEVAKRLTEMGLPTKNKSISSWEKGLASPNATQFLALCQIYNIEDIYSNFIGFLNSCSLNSSEPNTSLNTNSLNINDLNANGIQKVAEYIELLKCSDKYVLSGNNSADTNNSDTNNLDTNNSGISASNKSNNIINFTAPQKTRVLPVYELPASAGPGEFVDNDYHHMMEISLELSPLVPENADFGVRIHGDSMNPLYENGDIVWVRRTSELQEGDIGIFYLDGEAYCKKIHFNKSNKKESQLQLVSLNPAYNPINISENSDFRIYGRVLN